MNHNQLLAAVARVQTRLAANAPLAPRVATAALALLVTAQLAALMGALAPLFKNVVEPDVTTLVRAAPALPTLERLAGAHLFGEAAEVAMQTTQTETSAPLTATPLDLTLTGTLFDERGGVHRAIIGDGRTERSYQLGEELAIGGARLRAVHADHVILERDGRLETLRPPEWRAAETAAARLAALAPTPEPAAPAAAPEMPPAVAPFTAVAAAGANPERPRAPGADPITNVIRFTAYNDAGVVGLRAGPGRDSQTFRELGLKSGDVITGVNGAALGGTPNGAALLKALEASPVVTVSVLRDGVPQVLMLPAAALTGKLTRP
jgi:general secretion pathway protein C